MTLLRVYEQPPCELKGVLSTKQLTSKVTANSECPAEAFWVLQFYSVVYCISCSLSCILSRAIADASLQLHAPKAFVNSENGFSVPQRRKVHWSSSETGFK